MIVFKTVQLPTHDMYLFKEKEDEKFLVKTQVRFSQQVHFIEKTLGKF